MNSFQLKQTARSRRNNAEKVQRPLLNFKASKDKAKDRRKSSSKNQNQEDIYRGDDAVDNDVIRDHELILNLHLKSRVSFACRDLLCQQHLWLSAQMMKIILQI
jgi:hypothetical protein